MRWKGRSVRIQVINSKTFVDKICIASIRHLINIVEHSSLLNLLGQVLKNVLRVPVWSYWMQNSFCYEVDCARRRYVPENNILSIVFWYVCLSQSYLACFGKDISTYASLKLVLQIDFASKRTFLIDQNTSTRLLWRIAIHSSNTELQIFSNWKPL